MLVCDICQRPLGPGESIAVSMDEIRALIYGGFSPIKADIKVYEDGVPSTSYAEAVRRLAPDASAGELDEIWRRTAMVRTMGGWALCPECHMKTRPYLQA